MEMAKLEKTIFLLCQFILYSRCSESPTYEFIDAGKLDTAKSGVAAVYDGEDSIYIFGGHKDEYTSGTTENVFRYDLTSQQVIFYTNLSTPSHEGTTYGSAHIDKNGNLYYFGGRSTVNSQNEIYKLPTNITALTEAHGFLPEKSARHASVYDKDNDIIYFFGGSDFRTEHTAVRSYNVKTSEAQVIETAQLKYHDSATAVWANNVAYIFGSNWGFHPSEKGPVYKFDPKTNTVTFVENLGIQHFGSQAVLVDDVAWIIGSRGWASSIVFRFNTTSETLIDVGAITNHTPGTMGSQNIVYVPKHDRIYMSGGEYGSSWFLPDIRYIQLPFTCATKNNGLYPHQSACSKFISCSNGDEYEFTCQGTLLFNKQTLACDWPENVIC